MKWVFEKICFPLLHIKSTVYTFLSGIAISLSTNIFTTICIDKIIFSNQWNLYVSTIAFAIVSAMLLLMATKMSGFQDFTENSLDNNDKEWRNTILRDATADDFRKWVWRFLILFIALAVGIAFLATDFSWLIHCTCDISNNTRRTII